MGELHRLIVLRSVNCKSRRASPYHRRVDEHHRRIGVRPQPPEEALDGLSAVLDEIRCHRAAILAVANHVEVSRLDDRDHHPDLRVVSLDEER